MMVGERFDVLGSQHFLHSFCFKCLQEVETLHITLCGIHIPNEASKVLVLEAFKKIEFAQFLLKLRSLGAWITEGGKWVLYVDIDRDHCDALKEFAASISSSLRKHLDCDEEGVFNATAWIDVVGPDIFQPHVTIFMVDPEEDGDLLKSLKSKSGDEKLKNAATKEQKKKLSAREKSMKNGRREKVLESKKEEEQNFGKKSHLFKKERQRYKGYVFGEMIVDRINLEMGFQIVHVKESEEK